MTRRHRGSEFAQSIRSGLAVLTVCAVLATLVVAAPAGAQQPDRNTPCGRAPAGFNVIVSNARIIRGTAARDYICAGAGDNTIRARGGRDIVFGRGGDDRIFGAAGRDRIDGGAGADLLVGGPGRDLAIGGRGLDTCRTSERERTCELPFATPPALADRVALATSLPIEIEPGGGAPEFRVSICIGVRTKTACYGIHIDTDSGEKPVVEVAPESGRTLPEDVIFLESIVKQQLEAVDPDFPPALAPAVAMTGAVAVLDAVGAFGEDWDTELFLQRGWDENFDNLMTAPTSDEAVGIVETFIDAERYESLADEFERDEVAQRFPWKAVLCLGLGAAVWRATGSGSLGLEVAGACLANLTPAEQVVLEA